MRRRGRPRKVRDVPPAKKLFEEPGASSEEEVDPVSGSDNEARYGHEDDDEAYQPLINTIRSVAKLRGMRVQHQQSGSQPSSSRKSGATSVFFSSLFWQLIFNKFVLHATCIS